jgi:hypothetical protein
MEEHDELLRLVIQCLREHKLYGKLSPPQPAGRKVHVHRIVLLSLARRALDNRSSISLSGNLHPQQNLMGFLLHTSGNRTSRFRESCGRVSGHSDPRILKLRNSDINSGFSAFVSSRVAMTYNSAPRTPKSRCSIPEILKCQTPTRFSALAPQLDFSPFRDFALREFASPDARLSGLQLTKPEMVNAIDFHVDSSPPVHLAGSYGPPHSPFKPSTPS